jgi:hypothetical protein
MPASLVLENLESDQRAEAQVELDGLAESLRQSGFTVEVAPLDGSFHVKIEESAEQVFLDVLNVVIEETKSEVVGAAIGAIIPTLVQWARRRKHFRDKEQGKATAVIWGPDGREIRRVSLPEPEDETDDPA